LEQNKNTTTFVGRGGIEWLKPDHPRTGERCPLEMRLQAVTSSSIAAIGYDRRNARLLVEFRDSGLYAYRDVPARVFSELAAAPSKGRYVNDKIKGRFRYERVAGPWRGGGMHRQPAR
jgi:hypothetical protein